MSDGMTLEEIREATSYDLASMADCSCPDSLTSPGARMLDHVRDGVVGGIERGSITLDDFDDSGQLHEIADNAPSIYTHELWSQFLDLGAYSEDPEIEGEWPNDLNKAAGIALYQIADRLAHALCEAWREGWECSVCGESADEGTCSDVDGCTNPAGALVALVNERLSADTPADGPESAAEPLPVRIPGEALTQALAEYVTRPDGPSMEVDDMHVVPVSDVLTGPVDLGPVSDPLLELIERAGATDMGIRVAWRARLADAAVSRFRRRVWTATAVLAMVGVALVMWKGGVW